jgi:hypothetical protein
VTYLAAAVFFTLALLAALVVIHMEVRRHWTQIVFALRGEWHGIPHYRIAPAAIPAVRTARAAAKLPQPAAA